MIEYCPNCYAELLPQQQEYWNKYGLPELGEAACVAWIPPMFKCECGFPVDGIVITLEIQDGKILRESWIWPQWTCSHCGKTIPERETHHCSQ